MNISQITNPSYFYEKDDKDLSHYGNAKVDNTLKTVLDAISYLSTRVRDSSNLTLTPKKAGEILNLIKENKIDFLR